MVCHEIIFYKKSLYEIKDEDIIDVLDWVGDYFDKYSRSYTKYGKNKQETFLMMLEDGTCVILGNMGVKIKDILNFPYINGPREKYFLSKIFGERHSERHKGNLGKNGGDDIHDKHTKNVNRLNSKRFADKLSPFVEDIAEYVDSMLNDLFAEANESII